MQWLYTDEVKQGHTYQLPFSVYWISSDTKTHIVYKALLHKNDTSLDITNNHK